MTIPARWLVAGALAMSATGCAHAPTSTAVTETIEKPKRMLVTGSRIPRPIDSRTGLPSSVSSVTIYTREEIIATGRPGDLGAALRRLEIGMGRGR